MVDLFEYIILCEKASAAKNFAKALGGMTGNFDGHTYSIIAGSGHLLTLKEPHEMVHESLHDQYKSWALNMMPWDLSKFSWEKRPIEYKDRRSGKVISRARDLAGLKSAASAGQKMVIATDVDPSGEGELLAWEIIDAIGWKKQVFRMYFNDEAKASIQDAFRKMKDVSDKNKDGDYVKAEARNRWDFASMQLTRIATGAARQAGYNVLSRQGRLKSVIVLHTYEQLEAIKNYKRTPYYETKFKDENGHVFARKFAQDADFTGIRFVTKQEGTADVAKHHTSEITDIVKTRKSSAPGVLLDLSTLASILATQGYPSKLVLAVYQKMYEAQIVSYPRTEDKFISGEQFNEMLPLVDKIANLVGVDTKLLTHRTPRKTHVKDGGAHGANRPGSQVPTSLQDLDKYNASTGGKCAQAIYTTLAKNFLAMYGEDYIYDSITARLTDYPDFVTSFTVPVEMNFKLVFDTSSQTKDKDDDDESDKSGGGLGTSASPYSFEGANKKPSKPTMKWLMSYLAKHNVGTGATRTSTLSEITSGATALLTEKKGVLGITEAGSVTAVMAKGTWIGSVDATKQLFDAMDAVGRFERKPEEILALSDKIIRHDMPIMIANGKELVNVLGEPSEKNRVFTPKPKASVEVKGQAIQFNKSWGGHEFTSQEITDLSNGLSITIDFTTSKGKKSTATGKLEEQTFKGKKFWGFKPDFGSKKK